MVDKLSPRLHSFPKPRYYFDMIKFIKYKNSIQQNTHDQIIFRNVKSEFYFHGPILTFGAATLAFVD